MSWDPDQLTPEKLDRYRKAAESAWGDDTRHENYVGHPNRAAGQCYVTSAWMAQHEGGGVGTLKGHHFWVSPDRSHVADITGDQFEGKGPVMFKRADHPMYKGFRMVGASNPDAGRRSQLFSQRADHALHHGPIKTGMKQIKMGPGDPYGSLYPHDSRGPFYHSSPESFVSGDIVQPAAAIGHAGNFSNVNGIENPHYRSDMAYAHTDPSQAQLYGGYKGRAANIYQVEPMGDMYEDPENYLPSVPVGGSVMSPQGWRVTAPYQKTALDLMGPTYIGEDDDLDQRQFNESPFPMLHDDPEYQPDPASQQYRFVWTNGQLRMAPRDDHEELLRQAGANGGEEGPTAVGYADIRANHVTWRVASNVGLQSLRDVLWHYSKQIGWRFDGLVGIDGKPLGMNLGPVMSYYWREKGGDVQIAKTPFRTAREIRVTGSTAYVDKLHPGLVEWAGDMGLKLAEYPGGGNMLDHMRVREDLEMYNNGDPKFQPDQVQPEFELPKGPFVCDTCGAKPDTFDAYKLHMDGHQPKEDVYEDGHFPGLPLADEPLGFGSNPKGIAGEATASVHPFVMELAGAHEARRMPEFDERAPWMGYAKPHSQTRYFGAYAQGTLQGYAAVHAAGTLLDVQARLPEAADALLLHTAARYGALNWHGLDMSMEPILQRNGAVNTIGHEWRIAKGEHPKDMIAAAVPFVYDIPSDKLHIGYAGTTTHDVPGKISPGGIVEGYYEPGGKVTLQTYSTHPFSIRHLMDLWYHAAPQMEVTSLEQLEKDGKSTKLASGRVMYHSTDQPPEVILQQGLRASTPWSESGEERGHGVYLSDDPGDEYGQHTYAVNVDGLPMGYDPETSHEYVQQDVPPQLIQHMGAVSEGQAVGPYIQGLLQSDVAASTAYKALRDAGGKVYAVGGAPRDALQGKIPNDIDLMVSGIPQPEVEHILNKLPGNATFAGKNYGVFHYHHGGDTVEIALPRSDDYGDGGRRADGQVTVDPDLPIADDLRRRDFTANATAVDLDTGELVDPHGGADDIKRGVLRTTHPGSFREDPSRLVRALTMFGRFGLAPDEQTRHEMEANGHLLRGESPDLLNKTFTKTLKSDNPAGAVRLAHDTGLLSHLLPEVDDNWDYDQNNSHHHHSLGEHLLQVLDNTSRLTTDPDVRFAALLHDVGKPGSAWPDPETGESHYYQGPNGEGANHEDVGSQLADDRLRKGFNLQRSRINRITHLISSHMFAPFTTGKGARRFVNRVGDENADDLLNLREADQTGKGQSPQEVAARTSADSMRGLVNDARVSGETTGMMALSINGNDLLGMGMKPGPAVGQVLQSLQNEVVDDPSLNDRNTLMGLAQQYVNAQPQPT